MKWKEKEVNKYPDIILSDCLIVGIQVKGNEIIIDFSEHGFIKKDSSSNRYYRTDASEIVIEGCDIANISIKEIRTQRLSEGIYFESMYDIEAKKFFDNINTGKWKFEIVEEFYSTGRGLFKGQVRRKEDDFWCCLKIEYKNLVYLWNNIRYDFPI